MNYFKPWEELTIQDDYIFQHVMHNPEICKHFLEKLLGLKIKIITYMQLEKTVDLRYESKGVRFDIYVEDENGTAYDVEMQTSTDRKGNLAKRTRYYQSAIDANALKKGSSYFALKKSFVIFVCTFDPFDEQRRIYTFRNRCVESEGLELDDGATKIFLNIKGLAGELDDDIKNFLLFVAGKPPVGEFVKRVAVEVEEVKRQEKLKVGYMKYTADIMDAKELGRAEGFIEGRVEALLKFVKNLLQRGFSKPEVMSITECTEEQFLQAKRELDSEKIW